MMRSLVFGALLAAIASCGSPVAENKTTREAPAAGTDPARTAREFVEWYTGKMDSLNAIYLVSLDASKPDSLEHFVADYKAIYRWMAMVQRSNKVSPAYLAYWRTHCHNYADTLRLNPQGGPPYGFDYEFLMLSQEPDTRAAELKAGTFTVASRSGNRARVQARGPQHDGWREGLDFTLSQYPNRGWLIDSIRVPSEPL
jgi:hypothetical protein